MKYSTAFLQDLCLRKVINNLEYYPSELLACLPPTLRRPLLVHMPIVDLCQLENTCVFDGVDAEMVWKERYKQQTLKYTSLIVSESSWSYIVKEPGCLLDRYKTMREKFFATTVYFIFECTRPTGYYSNHSGNLATTRLGNDLRRYGRLDHPVDVVNYLVSSVKIDEVVLTREPSDAIYQTDVNFDHPIPEYELSCCVRQGRPLNHRTYRNISKLYQEVPPRYSSFLNEENHYRLSEENALMLLMDKCDYYAGDMCIYIFRCGTIRWNLEDENIKTLIGRFFSKVFKLELCCYEAMPGELRDILEAIMSSSSHLFRLTISHADDDHINAIAPQLSSPDVPRRIEELYLDHTEIQDDSAANALGDILSCQSNISIFEAHEFLLSLSDISADSQLTAGFINLLQWPHFKRLYLNDRYAALTTFSTSMLETIVTTFLTTPCSQDQSVILHTSITYSKTLKEQNLDIPQSAQEYKSLEVTDPWVLSLKPLKLKKLGILSFIYQQSLSFVAKFGASLQVSHLELNRTIFSTEHFETLLQNQSLKELQLVPFDPVDLCDITHGLVKIGETQTLETLSVDDSNSIRRFGRVRSSSRSEVEEFGEVLFSLPHLNCFSLELSIGFNQDSDMREFIEALFKSWKISKEPRLKKFVLNFISNTQTLQPLDENLLSIAEEVGVKLTKLT